MIWYWLKEKKIILLFLGLFSILIIGSYYLAEPQLEQYPPYRVQSPAPDGTKAFYQSLVELDYPVEIFSEHSNQLEADRKTLLFLFNPPVMIDRSVAQGYQDFVDAGGTIFYLTTGPAELFDRNLIPLSSIEEEGEVFIGDQSYQVKLDTRFRIQTEGDDRALVYDDYGVIVARQLYPSGEVIHFLEPAWFSNQAILEVDHLDLIREVIDLDAYDRILFDSYHYLDRTSLSVLDVMPKPILTFGLIVLIVAILVLWMQGKRFGPALDLREQTVRFGDERIRALANWQIKGRNYRTSLEVQVDYLKQTIFERTGTPVTASWIEYQTVLARLLENSRQTSIDQFIDQLAKLLESEQVNQQEFLAWTKRIDKIRREVEE